MVHRAQNEGCRQQSNPASEVDEDKSASILRNENTDDDDAEIGEDIPDDGYRGPNELHPNILGLYITGDDPYERKIVMELQMSKHEWSRAVGQMRATHYMPHLKPIVARVCSFSTIYFSHAATALKYNESLGRLVRRDQALPVKIRVARAALRPHWHANVEHIFEALSNTLEALTRLIDEINEAERFTHIGLKNPEIEHRWRRPRGYSPASYELIEAYRGIVAKLRRTQAAGRKLENKYVIAERNNQKNIKSRRKTCDPDLSSVVTFPKFARRRSTSEI